MFDVTIGIISGYLLGSIPSAYLAGRLRKGIDIRKAGSRNMGAVNVYYEVGLVDAVLVSLADLSKGVAAILLVRSLSGIPLIAGFDLLTGLTGAAAVAGHMFPVFLRFRGGKGGATATGVLLFLMPLAFPILLAIFAIAVLLTRNPTFSYSLLMIAFPFIAWLIYFERHGEPLISFSIGLRVFPGTQYIPRLREMRSKTGGDWRNVIMRRSLRERL